MSLSASSNPPLHTHESGSNPPLHTHKAGSYPPLHTHGCLIHCSSSLKRCRTKNTMAHATSQTNSRNRAVNTSTLAQYGCYQNTSTLAHSKTLLLVTAVGHIKHTSS